MLVTDTKALARKLYAEGQTCRAIAKILEVGHTTVWRWCKDIKRSKHA